MMACLKTTGLLGAALPMLAAIAVSRSAGQVRHVTTCLARGDCFLGIGRTVLGSATYKF